MDRALACLVQFVQAQCTAPAVISTCCYCSHRVPCYRAGRRLMTPWGPTMVKRLEVAIRLLDQIKLASKVQQASPIQIPSFS